MASTATNGHTMRISHTYLDLDSLAADIRAYRARTGISIRAFADTIGVSHSSLHRVEKAGIVPNAGLFLAICDQIGTDPSAYYIIPDRL